jgi:hypothetical protein
MAWLSEQWANGRLLILILVALEASVITLWINS